MRDLWADYAGEVLATGEAGREGGFRRRRLTEQAALMTLRAWLLRDYMLPYATSLGATRIFQRCYWLDGLGNVRGTGTPLPPPPSPPSPTPTDQRPRKKSAPPEPPLPPALQLVSETARQLAQLDRPITLYGYALDERRGKRKAAPPSDGSSPSAGETSSGISLARTGGSVPASWPELAPVLLPMLEQSAAVFLLNPLKESLFRYNDLLPLYQRTAPTELFLWFSHKQIETRLLPDLRTPAGAASLTNLLRGDRWKGLLARESAHPQRAIHGLIELFAESMRPHFLSVQQFALPMHSGPALVETAPYSLLFATRRQDSLFAFNDAVCQLARRLLSESQRGILNEAWFRTQQAEQAASQQTALIQDTLALGRTQRIRRWPDLRLQLLLSHFGQQTLHEYDQIIADLLARGAVSCEWRKPTDPPAIPGSNDLLHWK